MAGKRSCSVIADVVGMAFWLLVAYATVWSSLAITWGRIVYGPADSGGALSMVLGSGRNL